MKDFQRAKATELPVFLILFGVLLTAVLVVIFSHENTFFSAGILLLVMAGRSMHIHSKMKKAGITSKMLKAARNGTPQPINKDQPEK